MTDNTLDFLLWVAIPYCSYTIFWVGHFWRYKTSQYTWTTRSTELLEQKLLRPGILLFHFGMAFVLIGHAGGLLVPQSVTDSIGFNEDAYHLMAVIVGSVAGFTMAGGLALLIVRRATNERVRQVTIPRDKIVIALLAIVVITGLGNLVVMQWSGDGYNYRETVSPWVRSIILFQPKPDLMAEAPLTFQIHAMAAMGLFAIWPFTRLVHAWSVPFPYLKRRYMVFRRRDSLTR
jgi:nitrate reductase gamma subunit